MIIDASFCQKVTSVTPPPSAIAEEHIKALIKKFDLKEDQSPSISLEWRNILKDEIYELALECSHENWDGEGAFPITEYEQKAACRFIDLLPDGIEPPYITPEDTGDFAFDWSVRKDKTFTVILTEKYAIYAGIFDEERCRDKIRFSYEEIPSPINKVLVKYFRKSL